ncbi:hypothetical protein AYO21_01074 [Fonsecaea monophora]|uniref:Uncharacterized protein n=1 Tax=Fonsecaea monophora TaxID=254056 RepID=A0A177FJV1_9EURO|nr:hypothetical protein AYO21_01074 [Fonsecaea monophora]OAG44584.1 hypothetical protein AYO21_01074 [Fonsecaea monophora]
MPPSSDGNLSMPMEDLGRRAKVHDVKKRLEMTVEKSTEARALLEETYCSNDLKFLSSPDQPDDPQTLPVPSTTPAAWLWQCKTTGPRIASIGHLPIVADWAPNPSDAHARTESTRAELFDGDHPERLLPSVG